MSELISAESSLQNWLDLQSFDVSHDYFGSSGKKGGTVSIFVSFGYQP